MNNTTLILTPLEAEAFVRFQKYHALFMVMEATGAFNVQHGKVVLNYAYGELQNIVKEEMVFKKDTDRRTAPR